MTDTLTHAPGTVCWLELATTDPAAARAFYGQVFGWDGADMPAGDGSAYTMLQHGGRDVGGLHLIAPEQAAAGMPPYWTTYFTVEDVAATAARAAELGGTVLAGPMDVTGPAGALLGRALVLQDPMGATFAAWQPAAFAGFGTTNTPGAHAWSELTATDAAAAQAFYVGLFGYEAAPAPVDGMDYTLLKLGDLQAAGLMQMDETFGDAPSHWMTYFAVEDTDATAARIEAAGGRVCVPPTDIPDVGRFAVANDPQGAAFSVLQFVRPT